MQEPQNPDTNQLHPTELHDQVGNDTVAPEADVRTAADAGSTMAAGFGAVETEVTPLTPPAATKDAKGSNDDETYDPSVEVTSGGA